MATVSIRNEHMQTEIYPILNYYVDETERISYDIMSRWYHEYDLLPTIGLRIEPILNGILGNTPRLTATQYDPDVTDAVLQGCLSRWGV